MKTSVLLMLGEQWFICRGNRWMPVPAWDESLRSMDAVITDFNEATVDLQALDVKAEFAPAVIEKKLRTEGAIEGAAHILVHGRCSQGGGTQVLFTGIPVELWQRLNLWLSRRERSAPIYGLPDLMLAQLRGEGTLAMRAGRSLMLLQRQAGRFGFYSVRALSENADDLEMAARTLASEIELRSGIETGDGQKFRAFDLFRQGDPTPWALVGGYLEKNAEILPDTPIEWQQAADREEAAPQAGWTALPELSEPGIFRSANSPGDRALAWLTRYQNPLAGAVALVALTLFAGGGYLQFQLGQERQELTELERKLEETRISVSQSEPAAQIIQSGQSELSILESLAKAGDSPSPHRVLADIRDSLVPGIRILRISAEQGSWTVEGAEEANSHTSLARFLSQLQSRGYQVSVNSAAGHRTVQGYFSYRLNMQGGLM